MTFLDDKHNEATFTLYLRLYVQHFVGCICVLPMAKDKLNVYIVLSVQIVPMQLVTLVRCYKTDRLGGSIEVCHQPLNHKRAGNNW